MSETLILTLFFPNVPFNPSEKVRKPKKFWCFQEGKKGILGRKGLVNTGLKDIFSQRMKESWDEWISYKIFDMSSQNQLLSVILPSKRIKINFWSFFSLLKLCQASVKRSDNQTPFIQWSMWVIIFFSPRSVFNLTVPNIA